jgi:hypothetical protein
MNRADTSSQPVIGLHLVLVRGAAAFRLTRSYGPASQQSGQVRWVLLTAGGNERLQIVLAAARPAGSRSMLLAPSCSSIAAQPHKAISPIQGKPELQTTAKLRVLVAN